MQEIHSLWTTGRGLYALLGLLIIGIFISPLMIANGLMSIIVVECVFALILIGGVFATPCSFLLRLSIFLIAVLAVAARTLDKLGPPNFAVKIADNVLAAITLIAFSVLIMHHFLLKKTLLRYRITAAVAVYLIIGILWARFFEIVYLFDNDAFSMHAKMNPFSLVYFSFVTLVTIGYGDIIPASVTAQSMAIFEGVVGQLYLVILISSLVSEFSALKVSRSGDS